MKEAFEDWMRRVNISCAEISGLTTEDLPDMDFWEWWNSGMSADEAAMATLDNAGFPFDEDLPL